MRVRAVVLDLGHTIIDFGEAEDALRATYAAVIDLLTAEAVAQAPDAQTLIDGVAHRVWADVLASYDREDLEESDILALFDVALRDLGLTLDPALVRRIAVMEHRALAEGNVLPPENRAAVRALKEAGYRLGIVSNIHLLPELVREDLETLDLLDLFDVTVLSSEEKVRKPHPRIYQAVLARLDVPAAACVFVGDRLKEDVRGPKEAGMRAVLTTQFRQEDPAAATVAPDAVIAALSELPALLSSWERSTDPTEI